MFNLFKDSPNINYYITEDCSLYIGRPWSSIGDDETGLEFKRKVEDAINLICLNEVYCETCEETIYR